MQLPEEVAAIIARIIEQTRPTSIFLYGSRARDDFLSRSDYEVGVLYENDEMIEETYLQNMLGPRRRYRIYPYEIDAFTAGSINLPFETSIFIRVVTVGGKTIWGKPIVEHMSLPPITTVSLLREVKFQLGRASDALACFQYGYNQLCSRLFSKSCLWGTRDLVILKLSLFPISYPEIVEASKNIQLGKYDGIVEKALESRFSEKVDYDDLLLNVWYLNQLVEKSILDCYKAEGDKVLVS